MQNAWKTCEADLIARTGDRFFDFAPYVPAMGDDGTVTFQAALRAGGTGVFKGDGEQVESVFESASAAIGEICSHPDFAGGSACCYVTTEAGKRGLAIWKDGAARAIATQIGPLGPSLNARGEIAFRKAWGSGSSVCVWRDGVCRVLAESSGEFAGFQGVPIVNSFGAVAFCAEFRAGGKGIFVSENPGESRLTMIAQENGVDAKFRTLGSFPMINDSGTASFVATLEAGGAGAFASSGGVVRCVRHTDEGFESIRGVLIDGAERMVIIATPRGGRMGIFRGHEHVLSIGSDLCGSIVSDFALNGVSINGNGQLAIRVAFEDGGQAIVRV